MAGWAASDALSEGGGMPVALRTAIQTLCDRALTVSENVLFTEPFGYRYDPAE